MKRSIVILFCLWSVASSTFAGQRRDGSSDGCDGVMVQDGCVPSDDGNGDAICPDRLHVISFYKYGSHELTLMNVKRMAEEAGLCNILFVLAQSVLETGNFTSRVCREYNNLFGLYDSRHGDYYRFAKWEDSVIAYKKFIQYRYKGGDYLLFLRRIGYATDPGYTRKVARVARDLYVRYFRNQY